MDWEPAANQALVTNMDGTRHASENPVQGAIVDQDTIAKDICSDSEPTENEITSNQDTITSIEDTGSTNETIEKETNIIRNTVTSGDVIPLVESTSSINENVVTESTSIDKGKSHLGEPDVLPKSSVPKTTIDLTIDDSNDNSHNDDSSDSSDSNDDNDSDDDEPDKPDLSKLPDSVKIAIEMGELSHDVAEILRKEAIEHAKEEYKKLKEEDKSKFFSFSGTAIIVLNCPI